LLKLFKGAGALNCEQTRARCSHSLAHDEGSGSEEGQMIFAFELALLALIIKGTKGIRAQNPRN
jgi:hypothetical protein